LTCGSGTGADGDGDAGVGSALSCARAGDDRTVVAASTEAISRDRKQPDAMRPLSRDEPNADMTPQQGFRAADRRPSLCDATFLGMMLSKKHHIGPASATASIAR
jgi:hypothetical protein